MYLSTVYGCLAILMHTRCYRQMIDAKLFHFFLLCFVSLKPETQQNRQWKKWILNQITNWLKQRDWARAKHQIKWNWTNKQSKSRSHCEITMIRCIWCQSWTQPYSLLRSYSSITLHICCANNFRFVDCGRQAFMICFLLCVCPFITT